MNFSKWLLLLGFFLGLAAGCATAPPAPPFAEDFSLSGKVGVVGPDAQFSARLAWRQAVADPAEAAGRFVIDLWGPFGSGRVQLRGDADYLEVLDGDGTVLRAGSHRDVMLAELGWYLPLDVLPVWVLGRPDPTLPSAARIYGEDGRLAGFDQLGWRVAYDRFRAVADAPDGAPLPHRIDASRPGYRLRLAVGQWQF